MARKTETRMAYGYDRVFCLKCVEEFDEHEADLNQFESELRAMNGGR